MLDVKATVKRNRLITFVYYSYEYNRLKLYGSLYMRKAVLNLNHKGISSISIPSKGKLKKINYFIQMSVF